MEQLLLADVHMEYGIQVGQTQMVQKMQNGLFLSGSRIELFRLVLRMMFSYMNHYMPFHIQPEIAQKIQIPIIDKMLEISLGEKSI